MQRTRKEYHIGCNEACNIQVWPAIKIEFVMNQLISSIRRNSFLWNLEFRNRFSTAIATRIRRRNVSMNMTDFGITKMATKSNDIVRINVLRLALTIDIKYLVKNHDSEFVEI